MSENHDAEYCPELLEALRFGKRQKAICAAGTEAAKRLEEEALYDTHQGRILRQFLLGLSDSIDYPFDLRCLMELDIGVHADCIAVLKMEYAPETSFESNFHGGATFFKLLEKWYESYTGLDQGG